MRNCYWPYNDQTHYFVVLEMKNANSVQHVFSKLHDSFLLSKTKLCTIRDASMAKHSTVISVIDISTYYSRTSRLSKEGKLRWKYWKLVRKSQIKWSNEHSDTYLKQKKKNKCIKMSGRKYRQYRQYRILFLNWRVDSDQPIRNNRVSLSP